MTKRASKGRARLGPAGRRLHDMLTRTHSGRVNNEQERAIVEATANLALAMRSRRITVSGWARRMRVDTSTVRGLLRGERSLTLATLAAAFHALGCSLRVSFGAPAAGPIIGRNFGART